MVAIKADNKLNTAHVESLHLPMHFDRARLELQPKMLIIFVFTVKYIVTTMSKLHAQTRAILKKK